MSFDKLRVSTSQKDWCLCSFELIIKFAGTDHNSISAIKPEQTSHTNLLPGINILDTAEFWRNRRSI